MAQNESYSWTQVICFYLMSQIEKNRFDYYVAHKKNCVKCLLKQRKFAKENSKLYKTYALTYYRTKATINVGLNKKWF